MTDKNSRGIVRRRDSDILTREDLEGGVLGVRDARANFSKVIDAARMDRSKLLITDNGHPAAAVVPIPGWRILDYLDRHGLENEVSELAYEDMPFDDFVEKLRRLRAKAEEHEREDPPARGVSQAKNSK